MRRSTPSRARVAPKDLTSPFVSMAFVIAGSCRRAYAISTGRRALPPRLIRLAGSGADRQEGGAAIAGEPLPDDSGTDTDEHARLHFHFLSAGLERGAPVQKEIHLLLSILRVIVLVVGRRSRRQR